MLTLLMQNIRSIFRERDGVTAIEYGMIAALISVVIIVGVKSVGTGLSSTFHTISTSL